jgi:tRNA threonylcarbamoyladenosine biosynthesis protein TsaE
MLESSITFCSINEDDTERLGRALAESLGEVCVVALTGPLGAGKTRLVQAVAVALGAQRGTVVSPTFVLEHEYLARRPIYHIDVYRLRDSDEFLQLGADERFQLPNVVLIEWAERVADCLPAERLDITIHLGTGDERQFELVGRGAKAAAAVDRLCKRLELENG